MPDPVFHPHKNSMKIIKFYHPGAEIRSFASTCAQVKSKLRTWSLLRTITDKILTIAFKITAHVDPVGRTF